MMTSPITATASFSASKYLINPRALRIYGPRLFTVSRTMPEDARYSWIITLIFTVIAAVSYFIDLGRVTDKGTPIFDEKHYVPQAYQLLTNGHWVEDNPAYGLVVHPPLAKWFIALGEWLFGYTPLGWRCASAVAGTFLVMLIIRTTRRLTRSSILGMIAGILAISDGMIFLCSRTALLDIFVITFIIASLSALLVDRDQTLQRLIAWRAEIPQDGKLYPCLYHGPQLGFRWWRVISAICIGLACSCKWSGIYFLILFFCVSCVSDALARKHIGIYRPWLGMLRLDLIKGIFTLIILSLAVYMSGWCFWFANETAYDRYVDIASKENADVFIKNPDNPLNFIPALRAWWYFQIDEVLHFHENLDTPINDPHPWESKPWTWPMGLRPVLYWIQTSTACKGCTGRILLEGTPTMWWPAFPILGYALWQMAIKRRWDFTVALLGYLTGWLPWFININRQMYYFYALAMAPFLMMLIAMIIGDLVGITQSISPKSRLSLRWRWIIASGYISLTIICFLWLLPIFIGGTLSPGELNLRIWLPSWNN